MGYLAQGESVSLRADPHHILPECKSIVVLAVPYSNPGCRDHSQARNEGSAAKGRVAAYAWGQDYHRVLPRRLSAIVAFIEQRIGHAVRNRSYTDTGPIQERDLAQRAGLGWIGKNTCLINPRIGSYLLLAEILLDVVLQPDVPMLSDHCGSCTRCIDACPTACILPNRTIDARKCISYLTIELKGGIRSDLRPLVGNWVFGCDICQMVCPWNRFAPPDGDAAFAAAAQRAEPNLLRELALSAEAFKDRYAGSPLKRPKHEGHRRNVVVALGNQAGVEAIPALQAVITDGQEMVAEHSTWAIEQIVERARGQR
jgi:epoxyqueuosine reductase